MSTPTGWPATVYNHYGRPTLKRRDDGWVLALDSYDEEMSVEVSEAFAQAWRDQFPPPPVKCCDCEGTGVCLLTYFVGRPSEKCSTCDGKGARPSDGA